MPERLALTLKLPRGQDGFWSIIRALDLQGPWSVPMVEAESNRPQQQISAYVRKLARAGVARFVKLGGGRAREKFYRLAERPLSPPRLTAKGGRAAPCSQQQAMWNAMRSLAGFDVRELAFAATAPEQKVKEKAAQRYVELLARAGYLALVKPRQGRRGLNVWRLKPSMNTGPLSPTILKATAIFDRNRMTVMGEGEAQEAAA